MSSKNVTVFLEKNVKICKCSKEYYGLSQKKVKICKMSSKSVTVLLEKQVNIWKVSLKSVIRSFSKKSINLINVLKKRNGSSRKKVKIWNMSSKNVTVLLEKK